MVIVSDDVLFHIFSFLDVKGLCTVSQVCHRWNEISSSSILWKRVVTVICKSRNIKLHLGRAETWKDRCSQLICGRLYPRTTTREKQKPSFEELKGSLVPVEEGEYVELSTVKREGIRNFVENRGHEYKVGRAFYEHTKSETISCKKTILLQDNATGKVYGGPCVRLMLGLVKGTQDWNIQPSSFDPNTTAQFRVFVQSTSVNRALVPKTRLLYQVC